MDTKGLRLICLLLLLLSAGCGGGGGDVIPNQGQQLHIVSVTGVAEGDIVSAPITVSFTAEDDVAVTRACIRIDNFEMATTAGPFLSYDWDVTDYKPGTHTVMCLAEDADGNRDTHTVSVLIPLPSGELPVIDDTQDPEEPEPVEIPDVFHDPEDPDDEGWTGTAGPINLTIDFGDGSDDSNFEPEMPPMDPTDFDPLDTKRPLIYSSLKNGTVVWDIKRLEAFCTDDRGVNAIVVAVNDTQILAVEDYWVNTDWDTREYPDGPAKIRFYIRDNSGEVGVARFDVIIDNASDHYGPEIEILSPDLSDENYNENPYFGMVHFSFAATDDSGVAGLDFKMYEGWYQNDLIYSTNSQSNSLEFDWNAWGSQDYDPNIIDSETLHFNYIVTATDSVGNTTKVKDSSWASGYTQVSPWLRAANGRLVLDHYDMSCDTSESRDPDDTYPYSKVFANFPSSIYYSYAFRLPYGHRTVHAMVGDHEAVVEMNVPLVISGPHYFPIAGRDWGRFDALNGPGQDTWKTGIVSGANDYAMDYVPLLAADETTFYHTLGYTESDLELIDGDDSLPDEEYANFSEVVADPDKLYSYAAFVILDGSTALNELKESEALQQNLTGWVDDGGKLITSGDSCLVLSRLFPEVMTTTNLPDRIEDTFSLLQHDIYKNHTDYTNFYWYIVYHCYSDEYKGVVANLVLPAGLMVYDGAWDNWQPVIQVRVPNLEYYQEARYCILATAPIGVGRIYGLTLPFSATQPTEIDLWGRVFDFLVFNEP